jgi:NADPH:quinone reductase-like Zn-dependent oxidoreductase
MHTIVHERYGPPEALRVTEQPEPRHDKDRVLIRVRAAGVNRADVLAAEGIPYLTRLTAGMTRPKRPRLGTDVAGVVEAVGSAGADLEPGDAVLGWADGAFAELAVAPPGLLVRKPAALTFDQAAAVPTAAVTAWQALHKGDSLSGRQVLVLGASGGVGTFAVQIAKALGAEVTGVASTRNRDLVRSLGADHVLDYTRDDIFAAAGRYDLVVDLVGREPLASARRVLRPGGTYVVVGGPNPRSLTGAGRFVRAGLLSPLVRQRLTPLFATQDRSALEQVIRMVSAGAVLPVIDATYDLRDAPDALRYVAAGHTRGRVVLTA